MIIVCLLGGNVHGSQDQYTYTNEKKDYQWLGATMDGSTGDNDKFVVSFKSKYINQGTKCDQLLISFK